MILFHKLSYVAGILFLSVGSTMLFPLFIDVSTHNRDGVCAFLLAMVISSFIGGVLFFAGKDNEKLILNLRERIFSLILGWLCVPLICALPLIIFRVAPNVVDCLFETIAAVSTSGTTLIIDVSLLSDGCVFWKAFIQLIGYIGLIISSLILFPYAIHLMTPQSLQGIGNCSVTVLFKIALIVYCGISFVVILVFISYGITPLNACIYTFGAISSGGMVPSHTQDKVNAILCGLMFLSGVPITFFYHLFHKNLAAFNDSQLKMYIGIIFVFALAIFLSSIYHNSENLWNSFESAVFSSISSITTTGITVGEHESNKLQDIIGFFLNFIGGCFGSGTGGIKILRISLLFLLLKSCFSRIILSHNMLVPLYNGVKVTDFNFSNVMTYMLCYLITLFVLAALLASTDFDFEKSLSAVLTSINNNGPYFGALRATPFELQSMSPSGKIVLMIAMISGRIEFIPIFIIFIKSFWMRGK